MVSRPQQAGKTVDIDGQERMETIVSSIAHAQTRDAADRTSVHTPMLVLVHRHGCMPCMMFRPEWKQLSSALAERGGMNTMSIESGNLLSHADAGSVSAGRDTAAVKLLSDLSNDVDSVPYIAIWYPDRSIERFTADRTTDNILLFVQDNMREKVRRQQEHRGQVQVQRKRSTTQVHRKDHDDRRSATNTKKTKK